MLGQITSDPTPALTANRAFWALDTHRAGDLSFARATRFNLDDYVGLSRDHSGSYQRCS